MTKIRMFRTKFDVTVDICSILNRKNFDKSLVLRVSRRHSRVWLDNYWRYLCEKRMESSNRA